MLFLRRGVLLSVVGSPRAVTAFLSSHGRTRVPSLCQAPIERLNCARHLSLTPERESYVRSSLGEDRAIVDRPFAWEELVDIVLNKKDPKLHSRSVAIQDKYLRFTEQVKKEWVSVNDHILHTKFQFEKRLERSYSKDEEEELVDGKVPSGYQWRAHPSLSEVKRIERRLLLNEFPYFVQDGIEHWCLWKLCENVTENDISFAKSELNKMRDERGNVIDTLCWVNPPHLKSVPDIDHAHILCLRGKRGD